jgi:hypothetical protein
MREPVKRSNKKKKRKTIGKRLKDTGMDGLKDLQKAKIIRLHSDGTFHLLNAHPPGKEISERLGFSEYDIKKVDIYLEQAFSEYLYNRGLMDQTRMYRATQAYIALLKDLGVYNKMKRIVMWGIKQKNKS